MACALAFNPGSNSLKFELVELKEGVASAAGLPKVASASIDDIGKKPHMSVYRGREVVQKGPCDAADMQAAVRAVLAWVREQKELQERVSDLSFAAVRVVHGGDRFDRATKVNQSVLASIEALESLAPLHNRSSLEILEVLEAELGAVRRMVVFDTAFHRTLPEVAFRYPIERETADRYGVRKFGFHGLSHRYMLEQYAATVGKPAEACTLVTLHLESGSSACAIRKGKSVDTTMGLTPLEGLMMGTRCGSVDPAIVGFLMEQMDSGVEDVMAILEKKSGLLGIAGDSLDTRELVKREDRWARLALEMYAYRVRLAVGAYLAALGQECEAVIFGGGIGEDSPWLRKAVCEGLGGWGLALDDQVNDAAMEGQSKLTRPGSGLQAWSMEGEEGLQMVWECLQSAG